MFGGVADKYSLYKQIGEPFKEGRAFYVMVQPPFGKSDPIKVRFYTDKAHATNSKDPYEKPLWKVFGFESEKSSILIVRKKRLLDSQNEKFYCNWDRGYNWKGCRWCWYAPLGSALVPDVPERFVETISWQDFKAEYDKHKED